MEHPPATELRLWSVHIMTQEMLKLTKSPQVMMLTLIVLIKHH